MISGSISIHVYEALILNFFSNMKGILPKPKPKTKIELGEIVLKLENNKNKKEVLEKLIEITNK
jgi:hypothetical protein